jgi:hypothetical protein
MGKPDPPQCAEQDIGEGGEPQAHLVGAHGCRGGAVGEQIELAFLYPVLHLATRAVDRFVEMLYLGLRGLSEVTTKRGLAAPPSTRPRQQRDACGSSCPASTREVAEASSWLAARFGLVFSTQSATTGPSLLTGL